MQKLRTWQQKLCVVLFGRSCTSWFAANSAVHCTRLM